MPQIRLERVSKYYPQDKKQMAAVREINLTVEQGEFLFLTGSSGGEKVRCSSSYPGIFAPTSGAVFLDDINLTRLSRLRRDRLRLVFGRVPQLSTAHAETDHLRKFIRSRHADAEPEAPAYTNPDSRRLWLWSACLMWERVTQWSYPMGEVPPGRTGPRDYQQPVHFGSG